MAKGFQTLLVAACLGFADASAFLGSKEKQEIASDDVLEALQSIAGITKSPETLTELSSIEDELRPMFVALPKNKHGALDHATVRYALHRYFVQKHGWYMNGLGSDGEGRSAVVAPSLVKDRAPSFIQGLLEQRLHGEGLGLHDMAVFASTLSSLVHQEIAAGLYRVFDGLEVPLEGTISHEAADVAVKNYILRETIGIVEGMDVKLSLDLTRLDMKEFYPSWDELSAWLEDFRQTRNLLSVRNPFVQQHDSFESSVAFVQDMSHNFMKYQSLDCTGLKSSLVEMDHQGTGRVLLRDFYSGFQHDPLHLFAESVDYLRNLGALDDRDPTRVSVVIPNYLISKTNCLAASGFYSICCSNECEGLMRHLETEVAAPSGSAERIADIISTLPSDSVDAPRNLSSTLRGRLDEIARHHGGAVPLYGRLFSQWMHHAYPRECPFPHVSGTTSPMSPVQWMVDGRSDEASKEEVEKYLAMVPEQDSVAEELPWSTVEELVVDYVRPSAPGAFPSIRGFMFLTAIVSFAAPLVKAMQASDPSSAKAEQHMV